MAEQYFAQEPHAEHDIHEIEFNLADSNLHLKTDAGVFSKSRIDYGSVALMKQVMELDLVPGKILDLGTGYGPMGLMLAKKYPERALDLVDVNERALELARTNAEFNAITNVNIFTSDIYETVTERYALIVTNPPIRAGKKVVNQIHEQALDHLLSGGQIVTVLQKKQGAPSARKLLTATFGNCDILARDKGYYILRSVKQ